MSFEGKLSAASEFLESRGISPGNSAPWLFRMLRFLGIKIPPPHFRGFMANALTLAASFCILWGAGVALLVNLGFLTQKSVPVKGDAVLLFLLTLASGAVFGVAMGAYYRSVARKKEIPNWRDFTG